MTCKWRCCSCPTHQIHLEEPNHTPVPIIFKHYQDEPLTEEEPEPETSYYYTEEPPKESPLCRWFRRQKALRELKNDDRKEKRREQQEIKESAKIEQEFMERARRECELEMLERQEIEERVRRECELEERARREQELEERARYERELAERARRERELEELENQRLQDAYRIHQEEYECPVLKKKPKRARAPCQPRRQSGTNKCNRRSRFMNCLYRTCCQCYCYITIFLALGFVMVYFV